MISICSFVKIQLGCQTAGQSLKDESEFCFLHKYELTYAKMYLICALHIYTIYIYIFIEVRDTRIILAVSHFDICG